MRKLKVKSVIASLLVPVMLVTPSYAGAIALNQPETMVAVADEGVNYIMVQDDQGVNYRLFATKDGKLVIETIIVTRMGGGIGKCPNKKEKTFSYTITREDYERSIKAINEGQTMTEAVSGLFQTQLGKISGWLLRIFTSALTAEKDYEKLIRAAFEDKDKQSAKLIFETHCVDRGNMYGEPMYDYVVDRTSFE